MSEENRAVVSQTVKALNDRELDAMAKLVTNDFARHFSRGNIRGDQDWQAFRQLAEMLFRAFPDFHMTIDDMVAEGNKVAVRYANRGTHRGELRGVAPTGKQVSWRGIAIWRITRGRVAEVFEVSEDVTEMLKS